MPFGISVGDSSGIGPEVLLKAWSRHEVRHPVVAYGDREVLDHYNALLGYGVSMETVADPSGHREGRLCVIDSGIMKAGDITIGKLNRKSGAAARAYVVAAAQAALARTIAGMVTLPVNKEATQLSDPGFVGHTELIGEICGVRDVTIMLVSDQLIATHVSTHVSLRTAIERVKRDRVCKILQMTWDAVRRIRPEARIAVAGLNPHAGENGLFGDEDRAEIVPAVAWAKAQGMNVTGPYPPDTVFYMAVRRRKFDAIVCMYHDQGHIPLKLLDFENGVNVALGLPIVRTSVDHGTAFDIAGQGIAETRSFISALELAVRLAAA